MVSARTPVPRSDVGRQRQVGVAVAAAAVAMALFVVYIALWIELPGSFRTGNDFAPTYAAGRLVVSRQGSSIYRQDRIVATERGAAPPGYQVNLPYISPPAAALLAAPLATLNLPAAETAYALIQLLAIIAAAALIALKVPWPPNTATAVRVAIVAAAIGAPTVGALLLFGESDGLFTLAVTVGYLLYVRRHPLAGGVALGLAAGMGKPHLLLGVLAFLLFRRAMTMVVGLIATAGAVNLMAIAVLGPSTALSFVSSVIHSGVDHPPSGLVGIAGLIASWLGNGAAVRLAGLLVSIMVIALCARLGVMSGRRPSHTPALLAASFALSLLGSPHLLVPDLVMLIPAFMWLYPVFRAGWESGRHGSTPELLLAAAWVWLAVATVLDAANTTVGFPGRLTPWGLMLFAFAAWLAAGHADEARHIWRGRVGRPGPDEMPLCNTGRGSPAGGPPPRSRWSGAD